MPGKATGAIATVALPPPHAIHQESAAMGYVGQFEQIPYNPANTANARTTRRVRVRVKELTAAGQQTAIDVERGSLTLENGKGARIEAIDTCSEDHAVVINMQRRMSVAGPWQTVATMVGSHGGDDVFNALVHGLPPSVVLPPAVDSAPAGELIRAAAHDAVEVSQREFAIF